MKHLFRITVFTAISCLLWSVAPLFGMTIEDALAMSDGESVEIGGVVTSPNFGTTGAASEYTLQDPTAAIVIYSSAFDANLSVGDDISIFGELASFNGKREIIPASIHDITINAQGINLPEIQVMTIGNFLLNPESYESELIRINGVTITGGTWPAEGEWANLTITDGSGADLTLRIDSETNVDGTTPPDGAFDVIGVAGQFDNSAPYDAGYQILPRFASDIITGGGSGNAVEPLLTAEWDTYTWPYNAYYPEDPEGINGHIGNACGPTALAHVINYWESPTNGYGSASFDDNNGVHWEADFANTTYNYANMPDFLPTSATESEYTDVATLMYHTAVSMEDVYGSGRSLYDMLNLLQQYWGYSPDAYVGYRDDYTSTEWDNLFRQELDAGRVILLEGWTSNSTPPGENGNHEGHYFLVDGYNEAGQYHIKWNYGDNDGYFDLYNFDPYSAWNWAIFGLEPASEVTTVDVTFQADMTTLISEGFDPATHILEIRGSFNSWANGTVMQPDPTNSNIYQYPHTFVNQTGQTIEWKFKAAPDGDFVNSGWENRENRTFTVPETELVITESPVIEYTGDTGIAQDVTVQFSVDVTNAANFQTGDPFSDIQGVYLNGVVEGADFGWADWGSDPATTGALQMYNDGVTQGDQVAGDNIWTAEVTFAEGSSSWRPYKYGIYDPGNMAQVDSALDNESGYGDDHGFTIDDSAPYQVLPTDFWKTRVAGEYQEVSIEQVQQNAGLVGQNVIIQGVVTAATGVFNPSRTFIQSEVGGSWSGMLLFDSTAALQANEGDLLTVHGEVGEYYDMTEVFVHNFEILSSDNSLPAPIDVTTGMFTNPEEMEQYEAVMVTIHNPAVTNPDLDFGEWEVDDGSGPSLIEGDPIHYRAPSNGTVLPSITGVINYSFGNYKLAPRYRADINDGLNAAIAWDFESGLGDWQLENGIGSITADHPFSGTNAIEIVDDPGMTANNILIFNNAFTDFAPNDRIRIHVWLDDLTGLTALQPFIQFADDWQWFSDWYNPSQLKTGEWNLIELVVPPHYTSPAQRFGVQAVGEFEDSVPTLSVDKASVWKGNVGLKADFYVTPPTGVAPLEVQFTDQSTGDITSWAWDFGDGTTSTESNPMHTYMEDSTYTVTLTVQGPDGSNTMEILYCVTTFPSDYVLPVPRITAPVIDGEQDDVWSAVPPTDFPLRSNYIEETADETDMSGNFRVAADMDNLYFFGSVTDDILSSGHPDPWNNDAFEIYLDGDNSKWYQTYDGANDVQMIIAYSIENPEDIYVSNGGWPLNTGAIQMAKSTFTGGWSLEMAIPLAEVGIDPFQSPQFGLEVFYDDNDTGYLNHRMMWWSWGNPWQNAAVMGTAEMQLEQTTTQVTFQADITELLTEGFDPATHELQVRGDFSSWGAGPALTPVDGNTYAVTTEISGVVGAPIPWKFCVVPEEAFIGGGWELGANRTFSLPTADTTLAPALPNIYAGNKTLAEIRDLGVGRVVQCEAIVTSSNYGEGYTDYTLQDHTGGIGLYHWQPFELNPGDKIHVAGRISEFNGRLQILPEYYDPELVSEALSVLETGVPLPEAQVLTVAELMADPEEYESELVRIERALLTAGTWPAEGENVNLTITDRAGGELTMRIDKETDIDGSEAPVDSFTVIGPITQYDSEPPYDTGYQILPRKRADIFENSTLVTFQADMRELLQGGFDPDTNRIAVTGTFCDWQFAYRLYQSETDDSLYTRTIEILMPVGTEIQWKFYAWQPYQGYETGENRLFTLTEEDMDLPPAVPNLELVTLVTQDVTYTFTVDLTDAVNAQNGQPLSNVKSVFMHGFAWRPGFALDDTTNMLRTYDDGMSGGDAVAGDNIWSNQITFSPGTNVNQSYKYAAYDPDNLDLSNPNPMDNEAPAGVEHHFVIDDSQPEQTLAVNWLTTTSAGYHFEPVYTGNPYLAMNIYITSATFEGSPISIGDEIGIFDGQRCVGFGKITAPFSPEDPLALVAATDDPTSIEIDGFIAGNGIQFRLWKASENLEYQNVDATYSVGDGTFSSQGSAVAGLQFYNQMEQIVGLQTGWNIMSLMVQPTEQDLELFFDPLITAETLVKVQSETGAAIEQLPAPIGWVNNIGNWAGTEGYYINVSDNTDLTVQGFPLPLPFEIGLGSGWNIVSYPASNGQSALGAVQALIDAGVLVKVQNETGAAIEELPPPIGWVNNIGDFLPGEGYYINVSADNNLVIDTPPEQRVVAEADTTSPTVPQHYEALYTGNPYNPMNIYCLLNKEIAELLESGWELAAFSNGRCVGATVVPDNPADLQYLEIIAAMDDPITEEIDGFETGSVVTLYLWDGAEEYMMALDPIQNSEVMTYESHGTVIAQVTGWRQTGVQQLPGIPEDYELSNAYPNPFNPSTTIQYGIPEAAEVTIRVYDMMGHQVKTLVREQLNPGYYSVTWDGRNSYNTQVATGVYFYQMTAGSHRMTEKVVFIK